MTWHEDYFQSTRRGVKMKEQHLGTAFQIQVPAPGSIKPFETYNIGVIPQCDIQLELRKYFYLYNNIVFTILTK